MCQKLAQREAAVKMAMVVNAARFEALECSDIGTVMTNAQKWADHERDHPMSSDGNN